MIKHTLRASSMLALTAALLTPNTAAAQMEEVTSFLEEIVITARKKAETLQSAPITVTALTAESIQRLAFRDVADISLSVPGLSFGNDFGRQGERPVIRGQASILGESGVAFFIDGVYTSNSISNINVQEIERIEVVKGPQSALYGRNTYSGAINIITRRPGDTLEARVMAEAAEFGDLQFTGFVSAPITDKLGFILSGRYYERDGTFTNVFDGDDLGDEQSTAISGGLFFEPSESANFELRFAYSEDRDGPLPTFLQRHSENNCITDNGSFYGGVGRYFCGTIGTQETSKNYSEQFTQRPGFTRDRINVSLKSEFDFDFATFTHIIGYNDNDETFRSDSDHGDFSFVPGVFAAFPATFADPVPGPPFPLGIVTGGPIDFSFEEESTQREISTEFRLASNSDSKLNWLIGGFYLDIDDTTQDIRQITPEMQAIADANLATAIADQFAESSASAPFPGFYSFPINLGPDSTINVARNRSENSVKNIALFGSVGYDFSDQLSATVEARYAEETFDSTRIVRDLGSDPTLIVSANETLKAFTPRFTVDYQMTDDNLFYGVVAKGTKPGGLNGAVAIEAGETVYDEEEVWSFEVGTKNSFLDNQLRFNLAAFLLKVKGYQLTQTVDTGDNAVSAIRNAGDADIYGLELETQYAPNFLPGATLTFNAAWTDSEFQNGFDQNQGVLDDVRDNGLADCSTGNQFPDSGDCTSAFGDITGQRVPRQAEWQLFADATYRGDITDDISYSIGVNVSYESSKFVQVHNLADFGEFTIVNLNAGIQGDFWELQVFGRNITDEDSPITVIRYADGSDSFKRAFYGIQRPGSQWGGRLIFKY